MVIGLDWDGTLVERWTSTPLPNVRARLAELPEGTRTFIATNQAGPVWRQMTGEAKYPTVADVAVRLMDGLRALEWRPDLLLIAVHPGREGSDWLCAAEDVTLDLREQIKASIGPSYWSIYSRPHYRKPDRGMLFDSMSFFNVYPEELLYIGDMETDRQAAIAAGGRYLDAAVWRERGLL